MPKKDGSPTVAERRAAGTNKKAQNQAAKATGGVRPGSVADNRAKAKEKAQTMKEYKTENNINKAPTRKKEERQQPARQEREGSVAYNRANNTNTPSTGSGNESAGVDSNKFTTAAGYQMEKGAYNQSVTNMYETYRKDNPSSGLSHMDPDLASFDEEGYLSYDSTKPMWQANGMLKEAGYKVGDMLWKPGTKDNLNGRELTGRIGRISPNGLYSAEYVNDAVNSSHQSTGNAGYQGEVGLGADQSAYNRQYEQENDVEYGQVNQQLEANGFDTKKAGGTNQYGDPSGTAYAGGSPTFNESTGQYESYTGADGTVSNGPQGGDQIHTQTFNQPQGAGQSETNKTQANYNNSYASFNYQPNTSQYGTKQFDFKSGNKKTMGLNFDFDPNRFNQGQ